MYLTPIGVRLRHFNSLIEPRSASRNKAALSGHSFKSAEKMARNRKRERR